VSWVSNADNERDQTKTLKAQSLRTQNDDHTKCKRIMEGKIILTCIPVEQIQRILLSKRLHGSVLQASCSFAKSGTLNRSRNIP
jgi:methyl coenzyme M reductase beta subunit